MTAPTIASLDPERGHALGRTFVRILGTGFQVPSTAPADVVPVPLMPQRVAVTFGGVAALVAEVAAADGTEIRALTPSLDPATARYSFTANATTDLLTSIGHELVNGMLAFVTSTARPKDLPAPLVTTRGYYVRDADQIGGTFRLSLTSGGAAIDLTTTGTAPLVLNAPHPVDVVVTNLDASGVPVFGETVTLVGAYTPLRPNLSEEGHLATVIGTMIARLRRGVLENVSWMTQTDYDDESGDTYLNQALGKLPAIYLADLRTPTDSEYGAGDTAKEQEINYADETDPGDVAIMKPPEIVKVVMNLIAVSDDPVEMLNMVQSLIKMFRDFPTLPVLRDIAHPELGDVVYDIDFTRDVQGGVTIVAGDNTSFATYELAIRGVRLEEIPGLPRTTFPGAPTTMSHQPVLDFGKTAANEPAVAFIKKS